MCCQESQEPVKRKKETSSEEVGPSIESIQVMATETDASLSATAKRDREIEEKSTQAKSPPQKEVAKSVASKPKAQSRSGAKKKKVNSPKPPKEKPVQKANGDYKQRMPKRLARLHQLESTIGEETYYKRAQFFLSSEGIFGQYKALINQLIQAVETFKGRDNPHAKLVYYTTAHLLDKGVEKAYQQGADFETEDFRALIEQAKEKGLSVKSLSRSWNGKALKSLFPEEIVEEFTQLLF